MQVCSVSFFLVCYLKPPEVRKKKLNKKDEQASALASITPKVDPALQMHKPIFLRCSCGHRCEWVTPNVFMPSRYENISDVDRTRKSGGANIQTRLMTLALMFAQPCYGASAPDAYLLICMLSSVSLESSSVKLPGR